MTNRSAALSVVMLGAMFFAPSVHAQGHGAFASAPSGRAATARSGRRGVGTGFVRMRRSRQFFADYSGFAPYFSDYDSDAEVGPPPRTAEPAVQALPPAPPVSSAGLVVELQGDHWVRLTNYGELQTGERPPESESERASSAPIPTPTGNPRRTQALAQTPPGELPPAVLVFRDGHEEEIGKYLIVGASIYANSDYWSSGSWTRRVQIADLDVPTTLKLNRERGAKFALPSGPNEVMMRP
jgi:hypothetical protein